MSENCNRACWNCWYDKLFCDRHPDRDEDACEEYVSEEEQWRIPTTIKQPTS